MQTNETFETKIENAKKILEKLISPEITLKESVEAYKKGLKELEEATKMLEEAKLVIKEAQNTQ